MRAANVNGRTALGFFAILPYLVAVVLLSAFGDGGLFESALVFAVIFALSFAIAHQGRAMGYEPFQWWRGKFDRSDLKWLGVGYLGLLGIVFAVTSAIPGVAGILIALGAGGILLFYILLKTETILAPVIVHAAYNLTVIALAAGFFSSIGLSAIPATSSPIFVPTFGFNLQDANTFFNQAFLQLALVATAEELLKISLALGVAMFFTNNKIVMFLVSSGLWAILHSVLSFRF